MEAPEIQQCVGHSNKSCPFKHVILSMKVTSKCLSASIKKSHESNSVIMSNKPLAYLHYN